MKNWSKNWKSSTKPRKQRKYKLNAPLHIKQNMISVTLTKDLRKKHDRRNIGLRVGDKVKILRGSHKTKTGKVSNIDLKYQKILVEGIENIKKDGSKVQYPLNPTNLMITELNLDDKKRKAIIERKQSKGDKKNG